MTSAVETIAVPKTTFDELMADRNTLRRHIADLTQQLRLLDGQVEVQRLRLNDAVRIAAEAASLLKNIV